MLCPVCQNDNPPMCNRCCSCGVDMNEWTLNYVPRPGMPRECRKCRVTLGADFTRSKVNPDMCACCSGECEHAGWNSNPECPILSEWQAMHDAEHPGANGEGPEEQEKGECEQ